MTFDPKKTAEEIVSWHLEPHLMLSKDIELALTHGNSVFDEPDNYTNNEADK